MDKLSFNCYECKKETTTPIPRGLWQKKKYEFKCEHCNLPYKATTYKNGKVSVTRTDMKIN